MNDQKSINSTLGITCTRRCPACGLMNDKHMEVNQEFPGCEEKIENFVCQMCLSILHYGLRLIEHLLGKKHHALKKYDYFTSSFIQIFAAPALIPSPFICW